MAVDGGNELRSVAACEKQRRGGRSEESERGSQWLRGDARRAVASWWKQEVAGEAGGGRGSVGARRPRALPTGAGKTTGGEPLVGWASWRSWARWAEVSAR